MPSPMRWRAVSEAAAAAAASLLVAACAAPGIVRDPARATPLLLELRAVEPTIRIDLRYAGHRNFLGEPVYGAPRAFLRREAAEALARVQRRLRDEGLGLLVWDAYRPLAAQWLLWERVPDPDFVADPRRGSRHNRGAAVDVTLVDLHGRELEMPTGFDDFTPRAAAEAVEVAPAARRHRERLREAMALEGFLVLRTEWWHFDFAGWQRFPLLDVALEALP